MPKLDPVEAAKAIFFLIAAAVAIYAPAMYMLQSRHHGIDEHERRLQKEYEELENDSKDFEKLQRLLNEISIVQKRYNGALLAFILVMVQQLIFLIVTGVVAAKLVGIPIYRAFAQNFPVWLLFILLLPGIFGFLTHIFVDLGLALRTQNVNRGWLALRVERVRVGSLRPKTPPQAST